ncbi:HvfC/BufC N-terminal domain-containing protein [Methylacidiphilum caldifontis]|uniref:Putative DNA-binding domain-containing protein n=1 Tax=Methylacidiphilum caldifontis TaxID=2795386 RepID=A0A4Y8PGQ8_9BACT|nr:DNA-binding domain-containing protein [Methylacidiphilum caldifontis]TFE71546.1 hypothetical protein A7Q10_04420 [Methylacidiphilum caldifontis]
MKPLKPTPTLKPLNLLSLSADTAENLRELQRAFLDLICCPLTTKDRMRKKSPNGESIPKLAQEIIKPSHSMTAFERLEVYNQQYWFKIFEAFRQDFAGLLRLVGEKSFRKVVESYLEKYPPHHPTLWNIGEKLDQFLKENPGLLGVYHSAAIDMVRLEKALFVAFDAPSFQPIQFKDVAKTSLENLKVDLQPHLVLLELEFEVEKFLPTNPQNFYGDLSEKAVTDLRKKRQKRGNSLLVPNKRTHWIAIHRFRNVPYIKEIEYPAFRFLSVLKEVHSLPLAAESFLYALGEKKPEEDFLLKIEQWIIEFSLLGWFILWREKSE